MRREPNDLRKDPELLARVPEDAEAFGVFYRRHVDTVLAYVGRRVRDPHIAFDITAEVFASALETAARFDPDRGVAIAWLLGIARNEIVDAFHAGRSRDNARRRLEMQPIELADHALERIEAAIDAGSSAVMQAFADLPTAEREALQARVIDERDYHDIGREFAVSSSVIRKRVSRGLARLRPAIAKDR